jgi:hypothetical protein
MKCSGAHKPAEAVKSQMQNGALFWIRIGNLGEILLQTTQNDVHEEGPIKHFSWWEHDEINNSDGGEIPSKHDLLCTDKLVGPNWASYVSTYPDCGSRIFKVNPSFIPRDDVNEIIDLKFVEAPEKFPRNLDLFQDVTGGEDVKTKRTAFSSGLE